MILSARFATRAAFGGTVFLAAWVTGWLAGLASPSIEHFYAAAIEERNSSAVPIFLTADREAAEGQQATAMIPVSNVGGTAVVGRPERMDLSTVVTVLADVAPADLASPKPVSSLAEVAAVDSMPIKGDCRSRVPRNCGCPRERSGAGGPDRRTSVRLASPAAARNAKPRFAVHI